MVPQEAPKFIKVDEAPVVYENDHCERQECITDAQQSREDLEKALEPVNWKDENSVRREIQLNPMNVVKNWKLYKNQDWAKSVSDDAVRDAYEKASRKEDELRGRISDMLIKYVRTEVRGSSTYIKDLTKYDLIHNAVDLLKNVDHYDPESEDHLRKLMSNYNTSQTEEDQDFQAVVKVLAEYTDVQKEKESLYSSFLSKSLHEHRKEDQVKLEAKKRELQLQSLEELLGNVETKWPEGKERTGAIKNLRGSLKHNGGVYEWDRVAESQGDRHEINLNTAEADLKQAREDLKNAHDERYKMVVYRDDVSTKEWKALDASIAKIEKDIKKYEKLVEKLKSE